MKLRNLAMLSKWGWRFMQESEALWRNVITSIHGEDHFQWHTIRKEVANLRSPWISISRQWQKIEALAIFKVGDGRRITFWSDPWIENLPLKVRFPRLFKLALKPTGTVADHWDPSSSSWDLAFKRQLKEEELVEFLSLSSSVTNKKVTLQPDKRIWALEGNGSLSINSLTTHLSVASPIDVKLVKGLWKSKCPRRVNILIWTMLFGSLNCPTTIQRKLPYHCLSPHMCVLCRQDQEDIQHLFFGCSYASSCWSRLFGFFNFSWTMGSDFKSNVLQVLLGPRLNKEPKLLWINAVKALLSEIWFEGNQRVFNDKASNWEDQFEQARVNASSWCTLSKAFKDYSIQEFVLNWRAFIFTHP